MRRLGSVALALVLCVALVLGLGIYAAAGGLSGAQYAGLRFEDGRVIVTPGFTLDYELGPGLHLTADIHSRYDWQRDLKDIETRYDISANWYPDWWIFKGYCLSVGGVYMKDRPEPVWYLEVSRPFK